MDTLTHLIDDNILLTERRLLLIAKSINAGIWERHFTTGKEWWSPQYYKLLGYEVNEIPASFENFMEHLIHPDDKEKMLNAILNYCKKGEFENVEIRIQTKNGEYKWFEN